MANYSKLVLLYIIIIILLLLLIIIIIIIKIVFVFKVQDTYKAHNNDPNEKTKQ